MNSFRQNISRVSKQLQIMLHLLTGASTFQSNGKRGVRYSFFFSFPTLNNVCTYTARPPKQIEVTPITAVWPMLDTLPEGMRKGRKFLHYFFSYSSLRRLWLANRSLHTTRDWGAVPSLPLSSTGAILLPTLERKWYFVSWFQWLAQSSANQNNGELLL